MSEPNPPIKDIFDTEGRALRHKGLRRANEKTVLRVVGFNAGVSNAEISRMSGLAPQTVSAILTGLEQNGLIERGPALRGRRGQPATPIQLHANGGFAIGVELSWQHTEIVLINMHADVLGHRRLTYAYPDAATLFEAIGDVVKELRGLLPANSAERLQDLGLAMPGELSQNLDLLGMPEAQIAAWRQINAKAVLEAATGLEVSVLNDGNAACWAELIALPRPRPANIIYFLVSHYIAAGVVGEGALWRGLTGNAANLGSMLVQLDTDQPRQVHFIASLSALKERLEKAGKAPSGANWSEWDWPGLAEDVENWTKDSARALARSLFNATTMVESPLVIIDSVLGPEFAEKLVVAVRAELAALPVRGFKPPDVVVGRHGGRAPAIGAAELPLFNRHF